VLRRPRGPWAQSLNLAVGQVRAVERRDEGRRQGVSTWAICKIRRMVRKHHTGRSHMSATSTTPPFQSRCLRRRAAVGCMAMLRTVSQSPVEIGEPYATSGSQAAPGSSDSTKEPGITLQPVVEPIVFRLKPDEYPGGLSVPGDEHLLLPGEAENPREVTFASERATFFMTIHLPFPAMPWRQTSARWRELLHGFRRRRRKPARHPRAAETAAETTREGAMTRLLLLRVGWYLKCLSIASRTKAWCHAAPTKA